MVDLTGVIYALHDPRDGMIRYVGFTTSSPMRRYRGHLNEARCWRNRGMRRFVNKRKNLWLLELLDAGLAPVCSELLRADQRVSQRNGSTSRSRRLSAMGQRS